MKKTMLAILVALPLIACSEPPNQDNNEPVYGTYSGGSFQQIDPPTTAPVRGDNNPTQPVQQDDDDNTDVALAAVAGAAVGAVAMNALSNNNSGGYEVEKCDWDDHPNEPECRGTAKYYKWKKEQDAKKKAALAKKRSSVFSKTRRKPR